MYISDQCCLTDKIDFIVCLGGDGTLLYASSLFQVRGNIVALMMLLANLADTK